MCGASEAEGSARPTLTYCSANVAASRKIATNIFRVSFPVCVFWLEGW
jgi:hypothetical protein